MDEAKLARIRARVIASLALTTAAGCSSSSPYDHPTINEPPQEIPTAAPMPSSSEAPSASVAAEQLPPPVGVTINRPAQDPTPGPSAVPSSAPSSGPASPKKGAPAKGVPAKDGPPTRDINRPVGG